jgi:predicted dehydrogenase
MKVAIIGCGLVGKKRAQVLKSSSEDRLEIVCDTNKERAVALASEFECKYETLWENVVSRSDIQIVINSSINSVLESITVAALRAGKHVLCEKPLGRSVSEARSMVNAAENNNVLLKTGFNHRFHPALWTAQRLLDEGKIGKCLTIRAAYGHGGRPGMENEWRTSKELCGGGELLDQGVHLVDLIGWFGGEITEVYGKVETKFWNIEVEDNAFAILKTNQDVTAIFHASWTNWRNIFSFEVFGSDGFLSATGLGGNYGTESLKWGVRKLEGGKPDIKVFDFPGDDKSWEEEWREFRSAVIEQREPIGSGIDGLKANMVVEALYKSSSMNKPVRLQ